MAAGHQREHQRAASPVLSSVQECGSLHAGTLGQGRRRAQRKTSRNPWVEVASQETGSVPGRIVSTRCCVHRMRSPAKGVEFPARHVDTPLAGPPFMFLAPTPEPTHRTAAQRDSKSDSSQPCLLISNLMGERDELLVLQAECRACHVCVDDGIIPEANPTFEGRWGAPFFLVGQAPGPVERESRRPFSGRAGKELDRWMVRAGFGSADEFRRLTYIAALMRCFPGRNSSGNGDLKPPPPAVANCAHWLEAEL